MADLLGGEFVLVSLAVLAVAGFYLRFCKAEGSFLDCLMASIFDSVVVTDADFKITHINKAAEELYGCRLEEIRGKTPGIFNADKKQEDIQAVSAGETVEGEALKRRKDGSTFLCSYRIIPVGGKKPCAYIVVYKDVTDYRRAEEEARYFSCRDRLTGLLNRASLEKEVQRLDRQVPPVAVMVIDLNGLKLINDVYGRNTGDRMLQATARILENSCGGIVGRWSDSGFAVLLPEIGEEDLEKFLHRIKDSCAGIRIKNIPASLSLGGSLKADPGDSLENALKRAEDSMRRQKLSESRSQKSAMVEAMLNTLREKSFETEVHVRRMQDVAVKIGEKLGLPDSELNRLKLLVTLHDAGKIAISEEILTKKESLTESEMEAVKGHPEAGYRIACATEEFAHIAEEILSHHERWDGGGYPRGLKGEEIPLLARIVAVVDAYEVMSNGRPYKDGMPREKIIQEFRKNSGTQFDPGLVEIFLDVMDSQEAEIPKSG